jgi:hypothetical protein
MFKTLSNTMELIGVSWRLLNANRTLLALPAISAAATVGILLLAVGALSMGSAFDRVQSGAGFGAADYVFFAAVYFTLTFTVIYFNAALVSAAYDVLDGREASVRGALDAAYNQMGVIFGWACFATTVGLIIDRVRSGGGIFAILGYVLDAVWAYATYFVVPVLVVEGLSPFDALKRSTSLFQETWGKQFVANFGFGVAYFCLALVVIVPVALAFSASSALGIVTLVLLGAPLFIAGALVLYTMESIFRTALYRFATSGDAAGGFNERVLRGAYVDKEQRGGWGSGAY